MDVWQLPSEVIETMDVNRSLWGRPGRPFLTVLLLRHYRPKSRTTNRLDAFEPTDPESFCRGLHPLRSISLYPKALLLVESNPYTSLRPFSCWFSILVRRLLNKRASFASVAALEARIRQGIADYNDHLAKAFQWTYDGKYSKYDSTE